MPDRVITPIGIPVSCTATVLAQNLVSVSIAPGGLAMFVNTGGTAAFCAMVSASATAGEVTKGSPFAGIGACLFIALNPATPFAWVSGASAVFAQAVHYLK